MKASMTLALAAPALALAQGQEVRRGYGPFGGGWGHGGGRGGPFGAGGSGCASSCVSSFWSTATPTPASWCDSGSGLASCISSACTAQASEFSSYSSKSSSLCSQYLSCSSTGTYTYTYATPDGAWPFRGGDRTWPTGEVTVTGCPWSGDGFGFPFWRGLGYGKDFWATAGPEWTRSTYTTTVTEATTTGLATVEAAVSGDVSTIRTLGQAEATGGSGGSGTPGAASPAHDLAGVQLVGAALGAVIAIAGFM